MSTVCLRTIFSRLHCQSRFQIVLGVWPGSRPLLGRIHSHQYSVRLNTVTGNRENWGGIERKRQQVKSWCVVHSRGLETQADQENLSAASESESDSEMPKRNKRSFNQGGGNGGGENGEKRPSKRQRKKNRMASEEFEYVRAIFKAAKFQDPKLSLQAFRAARTAGLKINLDAMNSVLYVLVGGEDWVYKARVACGGDAYDKAEYKDLHSENRGKKKTKGEAGGSGGVKDAQGGSEEGSEQVSAEQERELLEKKWQLNVELPELSDVELDVVRGEVLQYMEENGMFEGEIGVIGKARLAACDGNPDLAFQIVKEAVRKEGSGVKVKLRVMAPALLGFASNGNSVGAKEIEDMMNEAELDLTEFEFRLFTDAYTKSGSYEDVARMLRRMGKDWTHLDEMIVRLIECYFQSDRGVQALQSDPKTSGKETWAVKRVEVDKDGYCNLAGECVSVVPLEQVDWDVFAEGVKNIALRAEQRNQVFSSFVKFIEENGPYHILVDGANVAYSGGFVFRHSQVRTMMDKLAQEFPAKKALLVLHVGRTHGKGVPGWFSGYLHQLTSQKQFFTVPVGSNDDWYWLYAAIAAKTEGLLISNDECRDHIFELLTPKYFLKWKERHIVKFAFEEVEGMKFKQAMLKMPPPYMPCTQQLSNGVWMVPCKTGGWLCAKPV